VRQKNLCRKKRTARSAALYRSDHTQCQWYATPSPLQIGCAGTAISGLSGGHKSSKSAPISCFSPDSRLSVRRGSSNHAVNQRDSATPDTPRQAFQGTSGCTFSMRFAPVFFGSGTRTPVELPSMRTCRKEDAASGKTTAPPVPGPRVSALGSRSIRPTCLRNNGRKPCAWIPGRYRESLQPRRTLPFLRHLCGRPPPRLSASSRQRPAFPAST